MPTEISDRNLCIIEQVVNRQKRNQNNDVIAGERTAVISLRGDSWGLLDDWRLVFEFV